jgi:hypothetical protein
VIVFFCDSHSTYLELCASQRESGSVTGHDADSSVLGRLRAAGFNIVDQPRPRAANADGLSTCLLSIVVIAGADIVLSPIIITDRPATFELACVRVVVRQFVAIVVVLYCPGSVAV